MIHVSRKNVISILQSFSRCPLPRHSRGGGGPAKLVEWAGLDSVRVAAPFRRLRRHLPPLRGRRTPTAKPGASIPQTPPGQRQKYVVQCRPVYIYADSVDA